METIEVQTLNFYDHRNGKFIQRSELEKEFKHGR